MAGPIHWNIRGLKVINFEKVKKCCSMLEQVQSNLFLNLHETHLNKDEDIPKKLLNYSHIYTVLSSHASEDDRGAGILMFINKTEEVVDKEEIIPGRLLFVKIKNKTSGLERNIFSFYAKSHAHSTEIKRYMSSIHDKIIDGNLSGIMIVGDFNFVTSLLDRNSSSFTATDNMYRHEWEKLEINLGLLDSFRITNPKRRLYSYTHTNGTSRSRIDRIYVSNDLQGKIMSSTYDNVFSSDHKILNLKFAQEIDTGPGQWIFNNTLLEDKVFVDGVKEIISQYKLNINDFPDSKVRWDFLKQNIASFSQNFSRQKSKKERYDYNHVVKEIEALETIPKQEVTEHIKEMITTLKLKEN